MSSFPVWKRNRNECTFEVRAWHGLSRRPISRWRSSGHSSMPSYDSNAFEPPAPVAHVSVRNPSSGKAKSGVPMLVDTGADVTLLPLSVARELGVAGIPEKTYELVGFGGSSSSAIAAHAELVFLDCRFRGQFLLIDQEQGIIGRNILNSVSLFFDGPRLTWDRSSHP